MFCSMTVRNDRTKNTSPKIRRWVQFREYRVSFKYVDSRNTMQCQILSERGQHYHLQINHSVSFQVPLQPIIIILHVVIHVGTCVLNKIPIKCLLKQYKSRLFNVHVNKTVFHRHNQFGTIDVCVQLLIMFCVCFIVFYLLCLIACISLCFICYV